MSWSILLLCLLFLLLAGALYQARGAARDRRRHLAPGRLIDVGGYSLHIYCTGLGRPAVVLESGIGASALSWSLVQPQLSQLTRVCSYDRAGLGWSDPGPRPHSARQCVVELHTLLARACLPAPYVMVAHSFGGLIARLYASEHPGEMAALVLLDPLAPGEWLQLDRTRRRVLQGGVAFSRIGALLARLGVVRLCLARLSSGSTRFPRLVAQSFGREASGLVGRLVGEVRKLPPEVWPWAQAHWSQPRCFAALADYLAALPESAAQAASAGPLRALPIIVLSAGNTSEERLAEHRALARLSPRGEHRIARGSGHWIQLDRPELVVRAVRDALALVGT